MSSPAIKTWVSTFSYERSRKWDTETTAQAAISPLVLVLLTPCVLLVHGYHPFADDAGIYVAGVEKILNPQLFPVDGAFVIAHTRYSIFSHLFAAIIRLTHISLEPGLLIAYLASIFLFLLGCLLVARKLFHTVSMQWGALLLAGTLYSLPVAATALWIMDPYVTARSFSTPFSLFAIAACMDRDVKRCLLWSALTAAMHPLMAAYLVIFLMTYALVDHQQWKSLAIVYVSGFFAAGLGYFATRHQDVSSAYREAVLSRDYFFLSNWHLYQWLGLVVPLLLMLAAMRQINRESILFKLCAACVTTGSAAVFCSMLFVHTSGSYFLAHLQFLRSFQLIYVVGVLLLGGFLAKYLSGSFVIPGFILLIATIAGMSYAANQSFASSSHVEWPLMHPRNKWQQAFLWIRDHAPENAVFAADSGYTKVSGEDSQSFRAIALRSIYADELKDGGVAAIFPQLASLWQKEIALEQNLNGIRDAERMQRFNHTDVTWLMLSADSATKLTCPYKNTVVQVCRLR